MEGEVKDSSKEHSSSTWAEVVSSGREENRGRVAEGDRNYCQNRWDLTKPDSETHLLTIQFKWNGVSTSLVGVSSEFEIALYTLCIFAGGVDNHVVLGPYSVNIKCYKLGKDAIGSVFPIAKD